MKILGNHTNVIQLFEVINSDQHPYLYLVTTYCDIGQIMLVERHEERFYYKQNPELLKFFGINQDIEKLSIKEQYKIKLPVMKQLLFQIINGLKYIHSKSIAHRDLKPDNIVYSSEDKQIKIIDFSISTIVKTKNGLINEPGGSIFFQAPEVFVSTPHDPFIADVWSLGIIMYVFMDGEFPFFAESELELQIKISDKEVIYPEYFDPELITLISSILKKNPLERIKLDDILNYLEK